MEDMKVFQLNDYEVYAGPALEEIIEYACTVSGCKREDVVDGPRECDPDTETMTWEETGETITLREAIRRYREGGETGSCMLLCGTEW